MCACNRQYKKSGQFDEAVKALDEALQIYDEDDKVIAFRQQCLQSQR